MARLPALVGSALVLLLAVGLAGAVLEESAPVTHEGMIHRINAVLRPPWVARPQPRFAGMSVGEARSLCGFRPMPMDHPAWVKAEKMLLSRRSNRAGLRGDDIPASFDARTQWPSCDGVIGQIRDQSNCGSCWAFASTEAFNDRLCIAKNVTTLLSTQETASCCDLFHFCLSFGCKGGNPFFAWLYFMTTGLVSGGDYGSTDTCYPYEIAPCHNKSDPSCKNPAKTPKCAKKCPNKNYQTPWKKDVHKSAGFPEMLHGDESQVAEIQKAIVEGGPVTAAMEVYQDFMAYSSGVYTHVTGDKLGGHAIKILGWGEESSVPYWLVANSWGTAWGEKGFFKIKRGSDECGIESTQITYATVAETTKASAEDSVAPILETAHTPF